MTYAKNFAVAIKVGGKVLRENNETVYIPFGAHFAVLLKNLTTRRAKARISIDGASTSDETWFVIGPNESAEIERFMKNNNMNRGNKFKFVERTSTVEEHRGVKVDDGLVRVEYVFEREKVEVPTYYNLTNYQNLDVTGCRNIGQSWQNFQGTQSVNYAVNCSETSLEAGEPMRGGLAGRVYANSSMNCLRSVNDAGITVPGEASNQTFTYAGWFETESQTHVLVLHLKGAVGEKPVEKPITVSYKPVCETCGKTNRVGDKFCSQCGAAVEII